MKRIVILLILLFCIGAGSCESVDDNIDVSETTTQEVKKIENKTYDVIRETIIVGKGTEGMVFTRRAYTAERL